MKLMFLCAQWLDHIDTLFARAYWGCLFVITCLEPVLRTLFLFNEFIEVLLKQKAENTLEISMHL